MTDVSIYHLYSVNIYLVFKCALYTCSLYIDTQICTFSTLFRLKLHISGDFALFRLTDDWDINCSLRSNMIDPGSVLINSFSNLKQHYLAALELGALLSCPT